MKKLLLLLTAVLTVVTPVLSQENKLAQFNSIPWWDKDYLTLTWSGTICATNDSRKAVDYINSLVSNPTDIDKSYYFHLTDRSMLFGSRLVEIDGQEAKGMTEKQVSTILASHHGHTFLLHHPTEGFGIFSTNATVPVWMQAYGFHPLTCKWQKKETQLPNNYVVRSEKDAPWRSFKTYDFMILSDDVLAEKELLGKIGDKFEDMGFKRDEEHPDIIITVSKDANKSIDYTYVPETQQQIQTGTNTYAMYGWKGKYLGNFSINNYKTVKSGGYTQKTASTSAYLEVSVLEASRMGEKVVPLIYQLKYNYNNNTDANVDNLYSNAVSWVEHPLYDPYSLVHLESTTCTRFFWKTLPLINFGIVVNADNVVVGLDSKSEVVKSAGLKLGDKIISINATQKPSMSHRSSKTTYYGTISVERNRQNMQLRFSKCHKTNDYKITFRTVYNFI